MRFYHAFECLTFHIWQVPNSASGSFVVGHTGSYIHVAVIDTLDQHSFLSVVEFHRVHNARFRVVQLWWCAELYNAYNTENVIKRGNFSYLMYPPRLL